MSLLCAIQKAKVLSAYYVSCWPIQKANVLHFNIRLQLRRILTSPTLEQGKNGLNQSIDQQTSSSNIILVKLYKSQCGLKKWVFEKSFISSHIFFILILFDFKSLLYQLYELQYLIIYYNKLLFFYYEYQNLE